MMQRLLSKWDDLALILGLVWVALVFYGVLGYPNDKVRLQFEKLKMSKGRNLTFQIAVPALILYMTAKIIFDL